MAVEIVPEHRQGLVLASLLMKNGVWCSVHKGLEGFWVIFVAEKTLRAVDVWFWQF